MALARRRQLPYTENLRDWLDPEHPVRWAWSTHRLLHGRVLAALEQRPDLALVRLSSPAQARHWLSGC